MDDSDSSDTSDFEEHLEEKKDKKVAEIGSTKRKRAEYAKDKRKEMGEALKAKDAQRKNKAKAMEELGKLCLQCNVVTLNIIDSLAPHYRNRISDDIEKYVTDNPFVNPAANKSCVNCTSTCGPHGCVFGCECFMEQRVCVHACANYVCNAMPHMVLQKQVLASTEYIGKKDKQISMTGLQIQEDCKEGEIIMEYTGPKISKRGFLSKQRMTSTNGARYYMEAGNVIINGDYGNEARYINSSCRPNCKYYMWEYPDGSYRIFITAIKNIKKFSFLNAKYNWGNFIEKCLCGLTNECLKGNVYL